MDKNKLAESIVEEWVASLTTRDRSYDAVRGNFDDLFASLKSAGIDKDIVENLLSRALKAHHPNKFVQNHVWEVNKKHFDCTKNEFIKDWIEQIDNHGKAAFYEAYPVEKPAPEPKVYGNITAKEYKTMRSHADGFPRLDTTKLEQALSEALDVESLLNILDGLKHE